MLYRYGWHLLFAGRAGDIFFCGYHSSADFKDIGHVLYTVEPYQNVSGCFGAAGNSERAAGGLNQTTPFHMRYSNDHRSGWATPGLILAQSF